MVAIVVPNWNGREHLSESLDSLFAQSQKNIQIIVVDNGSTDGSQELIRKKFPKVKLLELKNNTGFAGGVNAGIKEAIKQGAEFVALFNNDAVADKDWVHNLLKTAMANEKVGIVTCKFMQYENRKLFDSTGDFYSKWGLPFPRGRDEEDKGQFEKPEEVFGATGGASLFRTKMLSEVGLFDEDFFAYYEDVDLSFRAQLAGWKVMYEPSALAYHRIGATSGKIPNFARYHTIKNFQYLYIKNMPSKLFWKYLLYSKLAFIMIAANCVKRGQLKTFLRAVTEIVIKTPSTLAKRRQVQRLRKVDAAYIDSILYKKLPPTQKTLLGLRKKFIKST